MGYQNYPRIVKSIDIWTDQGGIKVTTLSKKHESFYVSTGWYIHPQQQPMKKQGKLIPKQRNRTSPKHKNNIKQPSLPSWKHPHIPFLNLPTWVDMFPNFPFDMDEPFLGAEVLNSSSPGIELHRALPAGNSHHQGHTSHGRRSRPTGRLYSACLLPFLQMNSSNLPVFQPYSIRCYISFSYWLPYWNIYV